MSDDSDQWSCSACTLMNSLTAEVCEACGTTSPLVLESYACEEQASAAAMDAAIAAANSDARSQRQPPRAAHTGRGRGSSQDSAHSDATSEDVAAELDPWSQAENEWAQVEAHQDSSSVRKRK